MGGRFAAALGVFVGSLLLGWWLGRRGLLSEEWARRIIRVVVKWLTPVVLCLSFWRLEITSSGQWWLPVVGLTVAAAALVPACGYAKAARLTRAQTGSFLTCAMFSNLGYLGAWLAFAVAGEPAFGLAMWYLVFFSPAFYLIGVTIAKRYGWESSSTLQTTFADELRVFPFLGLVLGLALRFSHVPRPPVYEAVNHVLIPVDTALYLAAIGSQIHLEWPGRHWVRPVAAMSAIKFIWCPLIGWLAVEGLGLEGLPRFVVLLESAMPVAISPLMLPLVFRLDRKLSGVLWVGTTAASLPWLAVYLPAILP